jgi:hypothetical protein
MKNPNFRATLTDGTKIDINVNHVQFYVPTGEGTTLTFTSGIPLTITDSPRTVRGAFRKAWPAETDQAEEA